jgi:Mg/Co/Ni transporter MgtE
MEQIVKVLDHSVTLRPTDKMRRVIKLMTKYNLYSAAVVDKNLKLAGIVTVDDVMRQLFPNA